MSGFLAATLGDAYRVEVAFDATEGLEKALELSPDIALVDLMFPDVGGEELVRSLRAQAKLASMPIVLVTAKADDEVRVRLLREGAQDFVVKPFLTAELRARVDNLVAKKRAEDALREEQRRREEWTSMVAHDLRQPASVIAFTAEVLQRFGGENVPPESVERIARGASAIERFVRDLLDLSRLESGRLSVERREVDLGALIREVVAQPPGLRHEDAGRLQAEGSDGGVLVAADPMRVEQVLGNLLSNAARYGDPRAEIRVSLRVRDDAAEVAVTNRGPGIAVEDLPRLFERFHRTERSRREVREGLGVGLYIAKGLVEAQGGRMWVESTPTETSFRFTLPRVGARS